MSTSRIVGDSDWGTRVVDGVEVRVTELVWSCGGRSFEVHTTSDGRDLTEDECFAAFPTDAQLAALLPRREVWSCEGCGTTIDASQADLVVDHVRDCDLVDGSGQRITRRADASPA